MADLVHNFGAQRRKRGASFKRATDATPEVVGEVDQHPTDRGSEEHAIVVMDSPRWDFMANRFWSLCPRKIQERFLYLMGKSGRVFPRRLLAGQPRLRLPSPGVVGCCFLTCCCYNLIFLYRAKLPIWKKYRLLGRKVPRRLSIAGSHSTGVNPRPPIWNNYTR